MISDSGDSGDRELIDRGISGGYNNSKYSVLCAYNAYAVF